MCSCEVVADDLLNLGQRIAKGPEVGFGQPRDKLHENEATEPRCQFFRHGSQGSKRFRLRFAVHAGSARVEDQQGSPGGRKVDTDQDGRGTVERAAAAIDDKPALLECSHADRRARPAVDDLAQARGIVVDAFERHQRRTGSERHLRARP